MTPLTILNHRYLLNPYCSSFLNILIDYWNRETANFSLKLRGHQYYDGMRDAARLDKDSPYATAARSIPTRISPLVLRRLTLASKSVRRISTVKGLRHCQQPVHCLVIQSHGSWIDPMAA